MQDVAQAELGSRKADLVTEYRLGAVKENLGGIQPAHCSFYLLWAQERKEKLIPLFSFSLQQKLSLWAQRRAKSFLVGLPELVDSPISSGLPSG